MNQVTDTPITLARVKTATKEEIKTEARRHGYNAMYSGRTGEWTLVRVKRSTNKPAFDAVVLANLTRRLGIDGKVAQG